jgi:hypothetical protein
MEHRTICVAINEHGDKAHDPKPEVAGCSLATGHPMPTTAARLALSASTGFRARFLGDRGGVDKMKFETTRCGCKRHLAPSERLGNRGGWKTGKKIQCILDACTVYENAPLMCSMQHPTLAAC